MTWPEKLLFIVRREQEAITFEALISKFVIFDPFYSRGYIKELIRNAERNLGLRNLIVVDGAGPSRTFSIPTD